MSQAIQLTRRSLLILPFGLLLVIVTGMALGVIFAGKTIKGNCGGLNAISDADKCLLCKKDVDPNSPLRDRLAGCPRARKMRAEMDAERAGSAGARKSGSERGRVREALPEPAA